MFNIYEHHKVKVLTKRQSEVYNFVVKYVEKNRIAPTYDEIRDGCELGSIANSYRIIKYLINKNLLHKIGKKQHPRQVYPIIDL